MTNSKKLESINRIKSELLQNDEYVTYFVNNWSPAHVEEQRMPRAFQVPDEPNARTTH